MEPKDRKYITDAILFTGFYLAACWVVFMLDQDLGYQLKQYGVRPRKVEGIPGIFTHAFLHSNYEHIWHNTMSFAVLNTFLFYFYRQIALKTFGIIFLGTGILLWLIGGSGNHIGASGVIYGLASFLFFSGIFRREQRMLRVALVVAFAYGSLFWYVFPIDVRISWEGHLSGAIMGLFCAIAFKEQGPARKRYNWEIQEELDEMHLNQDTVDISNRKSSEERPKSIGRRVVYHFSSKKKDSQKGV